MGGLSGGAVMSESERLAKRFFARSAVGDHEKNVPYLHPEAEVAPTYDPSIVVSGTALADRVRADEEPRVLESRGDN